MISWKDPGVKPFDLFVGMVVVHPSCSGFTTDSSHIAGKNLDINCRPQSVKTLDGIPKFTTHLLIKMITVVVTVVFAVKVAVVNFKNLSVITKMNS